jgi:chemotaxis methyl-accepting protein methylase
MSALPEPSAAPFMLRVYNDGHKGATAFFRNRPFLETLFSAPALATKNKIRIFVHACSIGAEPYSLALWWLHKVQPLRAGTSLEIVATDIDLEFLRFAALGHYPKEILEGMTTEEQSWFLLEGETVSVPHEAHAMVRFLAPMNFVNAGPAEEFDVVLIMNALTYVSPQEQTQVISSAAAYARDLLCMTAFHPDSIERDISGIGFSPLMLNHREIHEAWVERLGAERVPADHPDYSWKLPPYDDAYPDYASRFGVIFART